MNLVSRLKLRLNVLAVNIKNTYQAETAYFGNNWGNLMSTTLYTLSIFAFIKILYSNVSTFAGYTENQMLLLLLVSQFDFYIQYMWSISNIQTLIAEVNAGMLDFVLVRPVPDLFYSTLRSISFLVVLKDGLPNLLVLAIIIDWAQLEISNVFFAVLVFVFGQIAWHSFRFIFALPAFWVGQSSQIFNISGTFGDTKNIPLEGFNGRLRVLLITLIPSLLSAQLTTSVLLGKSDVLSMVALTFFVAVFFSLLKIVGWRIAIKNYTSASS